MYIDFLMQFLNTVFNTGLFECNTTQLPSIARPPNHTIAFQCLATKSIVVSYINNRWHEDCCVVQETTLGVMFGVKYIYCHAGHAS